MQTTLQQSEKLEQQREKARERSRRHRQKNPERIAETRKKFHENNPGKHVEYRTTYMTRHPGRYRANALRRKFGITIEERDNLFRWQGSKCGICGTDDPGKRDWSTDHCHTTEKVRGILCTSCNLLLGHAGDDVDVLSSAIRYLTNEIEDAEWRTSVSIS